MKTCRICGTEKPVSEFYTRKDTGKTRSECKECLIEIHRYKKLGVCNVLYAEMLVEQRGCCAICSSKLNTSRYTKLAVDHCHKTGRVRSLLCTNCNTALGLMKDSPERLRAAAAYLEAHVVKI
jgi:hypothetical protein